MNEKPSYKKCIFFAEKMLCESVRPCCKIFSEALSRLYVLGQPPYSKVGNQGFGKIDKKVLIISVSYKVT